MWWVLGEREREGERGREEGGREGEREGGGLGTTGVCVPSKQDHLWSQPARDKWGSLQTLLS